MFMTYPEKVRYQYLESTFGEFFYDISRNWEDYQIEIGGLESIKERMETQQLKYRVKYDKEKGQYGIYSSERNMFIAHVSDTLMGDMITDVLNENDDGIAFVIDRENVFEVLANQTPEVRVSFYEIVFGDSIDYLIEGLDDDAFEDAVETLKGLMKEAGSLE